uniref:RRM domain-containing protein n=1 Tax=Triticum aestivum TaxID=4565 RepID=A0A3B5XUY2_WHEAT
MLATPSMAPDPLNNASNSSYMLLRVLFFRLVLGLQVESSLSMEIISFWLWFQQGNGQVGYLRHIYSLGDNHFRAIVSSAKLLLEVLHFAFGGSEARSIPRSDFQNQAIEGISLYLNTICYEALEDLRERIEMNFVRNQMTYLRQEAYGQSRTDRVPAASLMTDLYQEAYGESSHEQIPNISMTDQYQEAYGESSHEQIPNISMTDLYQEANGESSHEQIPNSSKHLLTKIKALYSNNPKHHGEGTSSRNIRVQTSQMCHGEGSSSRNIHPQTSRMFHHDTEDEVYDYQPTSHLVTLLDKLSLRENHNDAITQRLSDVPPDERTLFVTFSNGYPLTKDELHEFFMSSGGPWLRATASTPQTYSALASGLHRTRYHQGCRL